LRMELAEKKISEALLLCRHDESLRKLDLLE